MCRSVRALPLSEDCPRERRLSTIRGFYPRTESGSPHNHGASEARDFPPRHGRKGFRRRTARSAGLSSACGRTESRRIFLCWFTSSILQLSALISGCLAHRRCSSRCVRVRSGRHGAFALTCLIRSLDACFRRRRLRPEWIGSGPVRLVSRATRAHSSNTTENPGAPVSFTFKEVAIADVLCVFREITGSEILAPPDQRGRLSIFAIEAPTNHLLGAVTDAAGLTSSRDGPHLILRKRGDTRNVAGVNVCEIRTPASSSQRLDLLPASLHELGLADIELVGLARLSESWKGYIYGPASASCPSRRATDFSTPPVKSVGTGGRQSRQERRKVVTMALPE